MKFITISLFIVSMFSACESKSQTGSFDELKNELSEEAIEKISSTCPYSFSDKIISNYKHQAYYKNFGNSGICIQFDISKENEKQLNNKLEKYEILKNNLISYDDSNYVFIYNNFKENIKVPELNEEFGSLSSINLIDNSDVNIYLIEKGSIQNVFTSQDDKKEYSYSIGLYYFKKESTLIYWYLIY